MKGKVVYSAPLGSQWLWKLTVFEDENGNKIPEITRPDGLHFRMVFATTGYDRPMFENFGPSKIAVAIDECGHVAMEPENILFGLPEDGAYFSQDRVIRASHDNPKHSGVPEGVLTGKNYLDGQRVVYRDNLPDSLAVAVKEPPKRKDGEKFYPCDMVAMSKIGESLDGPGKAAIFDAFAHLLPRELDKMAKMLYLKLNQS